MEFTPSVTEWLPLLGRVRFLIITFLLVVSVAIRQWTTSPFPVARVFVVGAAWYLLAIIFVLAQRRFSHLRWHATAQITLDLGMITGMVYASGAQDSYFVSLYLLAILMGSILFSRRGAVFVAGGSLVLVRCVGEVMVFWGLE